MRGEKKGKEKGEDESFDVLLAVSLLPTLSLTTMR